VNENSDVFDKDLDWIWNFGKKEILDFSFRQVKGNKELGELSTFLLKLS
jgi:hypothetical protein